MVAVVMMMMMMMMMVMMMTTTTTTTMLSMAGVVWCGSLRVMGTAFNKEF